MSQQITIKVSDQVARYAAYVAAQKRQPVTAVLAEWLETAAHERPVEELPDAELLAVSEMQLPEAEQTAMSELLAGNREGTLSTAECRRLDELMRLYEYGLLRKAQALRAAVQRGLREPLEP